MSYIRAFNLNRIIIIKIQYSQYITMAETINLKLKIWRQRNSSDAGHFEMYDMPGVNTHMSFLEMMDVLERPT